DVSILTIHVGDHAGGAAHHVAVAEGEVQSAAALVDAGAVDVDLGNGSVTGANDHGAAVLDDEQDSQSASGEHAVDSHGNPHVSTLVAGGRQHPLGQVAAEHGDEDDDDIGDGANQ